MALLTTNGFYRELAQLTLGRKHPRFMVAISGGMDSVSLLHLTTQLRESTKIEVCAIHVNHGIRHASIEEEQFVRKLCFNQNVKLTVVSAKGKPQKGESMEMWARRIRQDAYNSTRERMNCDFILTAHHSNDNIETILMHLNDGCGIEGLRGIPPMNGPILRPLLKYSRNDIQVYVHNHKFKYYEDESNRDISIIRNNIRHSLVKPWENQTDQFIDRFNDLSHKAINAVNRMNDLIAELSKRVENVNHQKLIHDQLVEKLLPSQLVRLVKHLIGETEISWRRHQWDGLEQWLKKSKIGSKLKLNSHWTILRDRNSWILSNKVHDAISLLIKSQGEFSTDGFSLYLNKIEKPTLNSQNSKEVIDAKIIEGKRLNLRSWRHGDVFQPLGMPGHKKVSDLLVDEKVDRFSKEKQLVLTANDEIIWVCGRRLSEKAKITNSTQEFLELSMKTKVGVSWT